MKNNEIKGKISCIFNNIVLAESFKFDLLCGNLKILNNEFASERNYSANDYSNE